MPGRIKPTNLRANKVAAGPWCWGQFRNAIEPRLKILVLDHVEASVNSPVSPSCVCYVQCKQQRWENGGLCIKQLYITFPHSTSAISKGKRNQFFRFFAPFECVESETKDDQAHFTMSCKSCVAHCTPAVFYASRPYKWCPAQRQMKQNTKNNLTVHPKWHSCLLSAQRQCTQTSLYKQPRY